MLSTPRAEVSLVRGQDELLWCGRQERASEVHGDLFFPGVKKSTAVKGLPMCPFFLMLLEDYVAVIKVVIKRSSKKVA